MIARRPELPAAPPRLAKGRLLRGANVHHRTTVFAQPLQPGGFAGLRTTDLGPGFAGRFRERFGGLDALGPRGCLGPEFVQALKSPQGVGLVDAYLEAILAVERTVACTMRRLDGPEFARVLPGEEEVELVWEAHSASLSRAAARAALVGLLELVPEDFAGRPEESAESFDRLLSRMRKRSRRRQWSTTTAVLARAARERGLPFEALAGNYLRLGDGITQSMVSESDLGGTGVYRAEDARSRPRDQKALHRVLVIGGEVVSVLRLEAQDAVDVTDRVHAEVRSLLLAAVARHGLPIAGVDYFTANVARSPNGGHGRLGTIRAQPDLLPHVTSEPVRASRVARAALGLVLPAGVPGRIPSVLVTGPRGTRAVARELDRFLRTSGHPVGMTTRAGSTILGQPVHRASAGRRVGPEFLLRDPRVGALVVAASPRHVVREGLRLEHATLTAILDPAPDTDLTTYREGIRVALAATQGPVALGVDNPETRSLLAELDPHGVILVSHGGKSDLLARHLADGGAVVRPVRGAEPAAIELVRGGEVLASATAEALRGRAGRIDAPRWKRLCFTAALALAFPVAATDWPGRRDRFTLPGN